MSIMVCSIQIQYQIRPPLLSTLARLCLYTHLRLFLRTALTLSCCICFCFSAISCKHLRVCTHAHICTHALICTSSSSTASSPATTPTVLAAPASLYVFLFYGEFRTGSSAQTSFHRDHYITPAPAAAGCGHRQRRWSLIRRIRPTSRPLRSRPRCNPCLPAPRARPHLVRIVTVTPAPYIPSRLQASRPPSAAPLFLDSHLWVP